MSTLKLRFRFVGAGGGSFSPASANYTLTSTGTGTMNWTASNTATWLTLSAASGTLAAGASTTVTATIHATANSFAAGNYSDTITLTNASNGSGNTTRTANLAVLSTNANLSSLALSTGSLSPVFSSDTTSYTATVANGVDIITLTPTVQDSTATSTVHGTTVTSGTSSGPLPLLVGGNMINIVVTPQSGTPTNTYSVSITRQSSIETWRQTWYGTSNNNGDAADNADPYHTGLTNLTVFAFFGPTRNPATASVALLPQPQLNGGKFYYSFTQPADVTGVIYGAEWSANLLSSWAQITDTGGGILHIFSVPVGRNENMFIRLKATGQ